MNKQDLSIFATLVYGYKVAYDEIPDADERLENAFADVADSGGCVTMGNERVQTSSLVKRTDSKARYNEQDLYIGLMLEVSFGVRELDMIVVATMMASRREAIMNMYELVMRKRPTEEPRLLLVANTTWWN